MLPLDDSIVFTDSSFFTQLNAPSALPSPAEVRLLSNMQHGQNRAQLIHFPSLRLIVKYGRTITIAEGQCLWAIRHLLIDVVPVPEVYGWCRDGGEVFIYMQLMRGRTLEELWQSLSIQEKAKVCEELRLMMDALGHLEQDPLDQFIGKPNLHINSSDLPTTCQATLAVNHFSISYLLAVAALLLAPSPLFHPFTTSSLIRAVPTTTRQANYRTLCAQNFVTMQQLNSHTAIFTRVIS
jgi:hypothetical protein